MFHLGYLYVIALAAVPVARTFLQAPRDTTSPPRMIRSNITAPRARRFV
jgi:hypothetical protein